MCNKKCDLGASFSLLAVRRMHNDLAKAFRSVRSFELIGKTNEREQPLLPHLHHSDVWSFVSLRSIESLRNLGRRQQNNTNFPKFLKFPFTTLNN